MSSLLAQLSTAVAEAVAAAAGSVVRVAGGRRMPGSGTVWHADGVILTAHHVVERDEGIAVGLPSGDEAPATVAGRDPATDLAVLRVDAKGLRAPAWAEPDAAAVGHLVLAVGRPGASPVATLGIISGAGRPWHGPGRGRMDPVLHPAVAVFPGFSGGPLVGADGAFLGLNTVGFRRGMPMTIPAPTLRRVAGALLAHGRVPRGYLGVVAQPVRLPRDLAAGLGQETGLLVMAVEPGSAADRMGLMLGDTLVAVAGRPVHHFDDLLAVLSGEFGADPVPVRYVRGGRVRQAEGPIGGRP